MKKRVGPFFLFLCFLPGQQCRSCHTATHIDTEHRNPRALPPHEKKAGEWWLGVKRQGKRRTDAEREEKAAEPWWGTIIANSNPAK